MIKRILVPTDFSEQSQNALKVAADLSRKYNSEIFLLHLLELPLQLVDGATGGSQSDLPEALFFMKLAHQRFEKMMNQPFLDGIPVHEIAEFDGAFEGIMDYARKYDVDIIVMGSHGSNGLQEFFVGSNTEKVVRNSEIPVLVIKNDHDNFHINTFVYACDFKEENRKAFRQAIKLTADNKDIHFLYVNTPNNFKTTREIEDRFNVFMEQETITNYQFHIYNDSKAERGILNFAKAINADLIGISTHGRSGIAHMFNGSLSKDLVNHAKRPVITFKI